jgi:hypothetical protein
MGRVTSNLSAQEIRSELQRRFAAAGLDKYVQRDLTQVLDIPPGVFVEVVLTDAGKIADAREVLGSLESDLREHAEQIDFVVRALWRVTDLSLHRLPVSPAGVIVGGAEYVAALESGSERSRVSVIVSLRALERIAERFALPLQKQDGNKSDLLTHVEDVVRKFLNAQLVTGGTAYWDPKTKPVQELDDAAASYLLRESMELRQLRAALDDFFGIYAIRDSLEQFRRTAPGLKLRDAFDRVVPALSSHFGGAYSRGERFKTSASELYDSLDSTERAQLKQRFLRHIELIDEDLKHQFPALF